HAAHALVAPGDGGRRPGGGAGGRRAPRVQPATGALHPPLRTGRRAGDRRLRAAGRVRPRRSRGVRAAAALAADRRPRDDPGLVSARVPDGAGGRGRRAVVVVLDACGAGALPDADAYGDAGADTLGHLAEVVGGL